ncbi:MAG: prepilin-type N-terminal cleavage/methylation domain-containing protein [Methylohalobius sp.]|nr:prepilin-type N-terminal cleavage/methylation domain-containing protein [Methylohalobius sp.]
MQVERGFSLLEVVVAFTVLALSLVVLLQAFGGGARLLGDTERLAQAASLAQSQLARIGTEIPLAEGGYQGEWSDYRWQLKVMPFRLPLQLAQHPHWQLFQVEVAVGWTEAGRGREYTLTTLRVGERGDAGR